jgi:hypothetical protein
MLACQLCGATPEPLIPCDGCGAMFYCSDMHRRLHAQAAHDGDECARMRAQLQRAQVISGGPGSPRPSSPRPISHQGALRLQELGPTVDVSEVGHLTPQRSNTAPATASGIASCPPLPACLQGPTQGPRPLTSRELLAACQEGRLLLSGSQWLELWGGSQRHCPALGPAPAPARGWRELAQSCGMQLTVQAGGLHGARSAASPAAPAPAGLCFAFWCLQLRSCGNRVLGCGDRPDAR